jgi:hypothetical protein
MHQQEDYSFEKNFRYNHYREFKKAIEIFPGRTLTMLTKNGSRDLLQSKYFKSCLELYMNSIMDSFTKVVVGSTAAIFISTFLLHRKRAWVLTAPGGLRSIMFKYLPIWFVCGFKEFYFKVKVPTSQIQEDFGDIQEEFWSMY